MGLTVDFNIWIVPLAALIYFALGILWYSPTLFAKSWMEESGKTDIDVAFGKGNNSIYIAPMIACLATSFILVHVIKFVDPNSNLFTGLIAGLFVWMGFVLTSAGTTSIYEGKTMKLFIIENGYHLIGILLMGAILGQLA